MTVVQIANLALRHLGVTISIGALADFTKEAKACNDWFDVARDLVTSDREWTFSTKRAELTLVPGVTPQDYSYAYTVPSEVLHVFRISDGVRVKTVEQSFPFRLELNAAGEARYLLTDNDVCTIVYSVSMGGREALLPADFVIAFTYRLASLMCVQLMGSGSVAQAEKLEAAYFRMLSRAGARDMGQGQPDVPPVSEFEAARL